MEMLTSSGYEITVEPSEEYADWYSAYGINREISTEVWGSGETEISAVRDCLSAIHDGDIFELEEEEYA